MELKPFLLDVPVRVNIWIRPECQREQFEVIKKARPSIIFLQSDGGRNEAEWEAIYKNRAIYENEVDWDCQIHRIYEDKNLGLYAMARKVTNYIWQNVDRCIFLEDDHIPSVSFFRYCAELLEKYKDDMRICRICGMNNLGVSPEVSSDYFFSPTGSIWGIATWRRVYKARDTGFSYADDQYVMKHLLKRTKKNKEFRKRVEGYPQNGLYEGHAAGGEFFFTLDAYTKHQLNIIPKYNMIRNTGATNNSAHADSLKLIPRGTRKLFQLETYELDFPMKHTDFVFPDFEYEKAVDRLGGHNHPFIKFSRKIERFFLLCIHGELFRKIKKKLKKKNTIEK